MTVKEPSEAQHSARSSTQIAALAKSRLSKFIDLVLAVDRERQCPATVRSVGAEIGTGILLAVAGH